MAAHDVVLDTNAWLDLLHFDDADIHALRCASLRGDVSLLADADTLAELARVVRYPALRIDDAKAATLLAKVAAIAHVVPVAHAPVALPRCRDADDQKFIELAARAEAGWLLTRDAELLRMAPRLQRTLGLRVCIPAQWTPADPTSDPMTFAQPPPDAH